MVIDILNRLGHVPAIAFAACRLLEFSSEISNEEVVRTTFFTGGIELLHSLLNTHRAHPSIVQSILASLVFIFKNRTDEQDFIEKSYLTATLIKVLEAHPTNAMVLHAGSTVLHQILTKTEVSMTDFGAMGGAKLLLKVMTLNPGKLSQDIFFSLMHFLQNVFGEEGKSLFQYRPSKKKSKKKSQNNFDRVVPDLHQLIVSHIKGLKKWMSELSIVTPKNLTKADKNRYRRQRRKESRAEKSKSENLPEKPKKVPVPVMPGNSRESKQEIEVLEPDEMPNFKGLARATRKAKSGYTRTAVDSKPSPKKR
jgi:hypothetical protein